MNRKKKKSFKRNVAAQIANGWGNNAHIDEVSKTEYQKQFSLLEAIFANAVASEINQLCQEYCCGCKIDHPSQRQHDCLMMDEDERWEMYGFDAIERVNNKRMIWDEFVEAARVLKLRCHKDVLDHLRQLEKTPDSMFVQSLRDLHSGTANPELDCVLNYLSYWRKK